MCFVQSSGMNSQIEDCSTELIEKRPFTGYDQACYPQNSFDLKSVLGQNRVITSSHSNAFPNIKKNGLTYVSATIASWFCSKPSAEANSLVTYLLQPSIKLPKPD
jgi:hypothetical protein